MEEGIEDSRMGGNEETGGNEEEIKEGEKRK